MSEHDKSPETIAAHAAFGADPETGEVVPPVHVATTYARDAAYELRGPVSYLRGGNPTTRHAESLLASLEHGSDARVFASGMAAIVTFLETVPQGAHVAAPEVMYHGTRDWLRRLAAKQRIELTLFDAAKPEALPAAVRKGETDVVWIETPLNPTWDVIDITAGAKIAHSAGAILAVDSTCASPVLTRPLALGADIVFHSATKYLNGHSDVLAGALVTRKSDARWQEIIELRTLLGSMLGPMEAWMLIRGMRTVFVRVRQACASALAIAEHFNTHPSLEKVLYPGLAGHPQHNVAAAQMDGGFGGMMSLLVKGDVERTAQIVNRLKVFVPATSLGGVESLAEHRKLVEGPNSPVPDNLIRLSIGIEATQDLIADLEQALA